MATTTITVTYDEIDKALQSIQRKSELTKEERHRRRGILMEPRMRPILPGLVLGNVLASYNRPLLREHHITAMVSLDQIRSNFWRTRTRQAGVSAERHKLIEAVDTSTQDLLVHMSEICDFIESVASPALRSLTSMPNPNSGSLTAELTGANSDHGAVFVHCELGISRSSTVIIAYLMRKWRASREHVLAFVNTKQRVRPSTNFTRQLDFWGQTEYDIWEDKNGIVPKREYWEWNWERAAELRRKGLRGDEPIFSWDT
jgi:protein-tyrosine phosphatase